MQYPDHPRPAGGAVATASRVKKNFRASWFSLLCAAVVAALPLPTFAQLFTQTQTLFGDPNPAEYFGYFVAVSGDTLVVSTGSNKRVYVFVRTQGGWSLQQKFPVNISQYSNGYVAIDGDTLVCGSEIYVRSGSVWTLQQSLPFADPRPAIQGDTLIVGEPYMGPNGGDGSVYVYTRAGTTWTQQIRLLPDAPGLGENMGASVKFDGGTFVATIASGSGGAYVFAGSGASWTRQTRLTLPSGSGWMGASIQGNTVALSDPASNLIYLYDRVGTTWSRTATIPVPATGGDAFGDRVALSGTLLSATADGLFYVFSHTGTGWVVAQSFGGGSFAGDLALVNRGKTFVLANWLDNTQGYAEGIVKTFVTLPPPTPGGGWQDDDVGAVGLAGSSTDNNGSVTVRGSGADIWDRADQFHFRSETLTGDGAIVARLSATGAGNPWSKIGLMFREDLAPAARNALVFLTPGNHLGLQARADTFDTTGFQDAGWAGTPLWLMLARAGNTFAAYRSPDGATWSPIGSTTVAMPPTVYLGLVVSSHDNTALNTGTFDGIDIVAGNPPPPNDLNPPSNLTAALVGDSDARLQWTDNSADETGFAIERALGDATGTFGQIATVSANIVTFTDTGLAANTTYSYRVRAIRSGDSSAASNTVTLTTPVTTPGELRGDDIGDVAVPGSASTANGITTISAAGTDIWDLADSFFFFHREISGDFEVRAHITSLADTNAWAKSGVMIRASLDAGAPNVFTMLTAENVAALQSRATAGAATSLTAGPWVRAPYWTRLVRAGNTFTAYLSADGANWTAIGTQTVSMGATVFAGIAVTSHNSGTATQSTIESLAFTPN